MDFPPAVLTYKGVMSLSRQTNRIEAEDIRARLLEKASSLPLCPGVYIMKDKTNKIIYIGIGNYFMAFY